VCYSDFHFGPLQKPIAMGGDPRIKDSTSGRDGTGSWRKGLRGEGDRGETILGNKLLSWLSRTPVQSFLLCPLAVIGFELALHGGGINFVPWGLPLLAWGYLQYRLVGRY